MTKSDRIMATRHIADPNIAYQFKTLVLERVRRVLSYQVSQEFLDNMSVNVAFDTAAKSIASQIVYDVYGRKVSEQAEESIQVPDTWIDAVKERFFNRDWCRRYAWLNKITQPKYRRIDIVIKRYHMCPHVNVRYDTCRGNMHIAYLAGDAGARS